LIKHSNGSLGSSILFDFIFDDGVLAGGSLGAAERFVILS
jgi:hypothetical protein